MERTALAHPGLLDNWNTLLDWLFYDVPALTLEERAWLTHRAFPEGTLIHVEPRRGEHMGMARTSLPRLMALGDDVPLAVAVPGVGSSAVSAGALARNLADHLGRPVVAVVGGNRDGDVASDALGGWAVLEAHNDMRSFEDNLRDLMLQHHGHHRHDGSQLPGYGLTRLMQSLSRVTAAPLEGDEAHATDALDPASEAEVLQALLSGPARLVVAHSKGARVVATAVRHLLDTPEARLPDALRIVTLGAVERFPRGTPAVTQLLGTLDAFGWMNSTSALLGWMANPLVGSPFVPVPAAGHSLSRLLPGSMKLSLALELAGIPAGE